MFDLTIDSQTNTARLEVLSTLDVDMRSDFHDITQEFVRAPVDNLVLDLTEIPSIFSLFIGVIVDLNNICASSGKKLTIETNQKVAKIFEILSFDTLLNIKIKK